MSTPKLVKSYVAEAAVLPYRVVKFGTAEGQVIQAAAAADACIGIASEIGQATVGGRIDVTHEGVQEAEAGAAVARGALLMSDASGRVITGTAAAGTNYGVIGRALAAAGAAGEIIPVLLAVGQAQG